MYEQIQDLYAYCVERGIECRLRPLADGYVLKFNDGSDFAQHRGTYGADIGCVEPAISGCKSNYKPTTLQNAKRIVRRRKAQLQSCISPNIGATPCFMEVEKK